MKRTKGDIHQHFIRSKRCFAHASEEFVEGEGALAFDALERHLGVHRPQGCDGVVGRAGGDQIAGDGASIADLRGAYLPAGFGQWESPLDAQLRAHHQVVSYQRSQVDQPVIPQPNSIQAWYTCHVDNYARSANLTFHFKNKVSATRHDASIAAVVGQQCQCFTEGRRGMVRAPHRLNYSRLMDSVGPVTKRLF